jgi:hypothetical protein
VRQGGQKWWKYQAWSMLDNLDQNAANIARWPGATFVEFYMDNGTAYFKIVNNYIILTLFSVLIKA